jgi:polyferredoxin
MMGLVFSGNLIFLYMFWEITAITSWRLIGFFREREHVVRADKAFLVTVFGALAMLLGSLLLPFFIGRWFCGWFCPVGALQDGILKQEEQTALYLVEHRFRYQDSARSRFSLLARVKLESLSSGRIRPHEMTHEEAQRGPPPAPAPLQCQPQHYDHGVWRPA